ncbi:integrase [Anaerosolibacter carboniphilus]|uniref:Integrase n=1 Tax=Anaerosolibacter carboniphilus TaxID=1417629 RepID=A0A841L5F2_9FIRM|nr:site-specific integrase [Anaerosolibacter carboniphilus]MBB6217545.1 integrase [Anaerosolibacter carboniphilus]
MKGYFRKRNCTCKKKKCTCGAKWSFTIDIGIDPTTGKRRQKTMSGFTTKEEAERKATEIYYELIQGTYIEEKDITFEEFAHEWIKMYEKSGVKVSTIRVRQHEMGHLIAHYKYVKLKDITRRMYQNCLNSLSEHLAYSTVSGIHTCAKMIFSKAMELDMLKINPTDFAKVPKEQVTVEQLETEEEIPKYLEKDELILFLKTAKEKGMETDYLTFKLLAYTGIRAGELCALKWKDVNMKEHTISITKTWYNPKNQTTNYQLLPPKTKNSKRIIEVDEGLIEDLKKHKAKQAKVKIRHADTWHDGDFVLGKISGKYLGYPELIKVIEARMARLLKLSKLNEALTPHSLRHTHTSLLAEAGVGLQEIMDRLGHRDDDTTRNVYLHVTKTKKKEAAQKFSELMNSL